VLGGGVWCVLSAAFEAEVVVCFALVDGGFGGWDQFCAHHGLAVPGGCAVDGDAGALGGRGVGGVGVVGADVDVVGGGTGAVDVVLVGADLVFPGPFADVCGGGAGEAAVPEEGGHAGACQQGGGEGDGVEVHFCFCFDV